MTRRERKAAVADLAKSLGREKAEEVDELASLGFTTPEYDLPRRIIIMSRAKQKKGKTHFSLTAPGPIGVINLDEGLKGVVEKFKNKAVIIKSFSSQLQAALDGKKFNQDAMNDEWDAVVQAWMALVRSPLIRTVVGETGSDMWELCQMAHFGTDDPRGVKGQHSTFKWGPPKREFRRLIEVAKMRKDINIILTHRARDEYGKNDKKTGEEEHVGFKEMPYVTEVNIEHLKEDDEFGIRIIDNRFDPKQEGDELWGPEACFAGLATHIFPETKLSDWADRKKR